MIHYSCDRCKKIIDTEDELRYVVRIEIQASIDTGDLDDPEGDRDHLHEIDEFLKRNDDEDGEDICEDIYQQHRYDLCSECYDHFVRNPLAADSQIQVEFSEN